MIQRLGLLGLTVVFLSACIHHHQTRHPHGMPPGQAKKSLHVHADGCGHVLRNGVWVEVSVGVGQVKGGKAKH